MKLTIAQFGDFHAAVHEGKRPFDWQQRLLEQVVQDRTWPRVLDLPTGVGKTTCIDIAVFALALDTENEETARWCPRRIAMVVDRRIVVDQVAERGRALLRTLLTSREGVVVEVAARLRALSGGEEGPLGVFTLRGGIPQDDGWAGTPDKALVLASTVDHIGSRILIQGYGVSQGMKPVHAGLLANDTLLLLDEVHLSEPFRQTLEQMACLRQRFSQTGLRPRFQHCFLSATPGIENQAAFKLLYGETKPDSALGPRLHAGKPVRLIEVADRAELDRTCVEQSKALLAKHRTVGVVVNRITSASAIARQLAETLSSDVTVTLLTGRMRPLDREDVLDELRPAIQAGRPRNCGLPKRIIVGTQCLEAGADFDFDALVTEAASLDSLRQRFGRLDRLGTYRLAEGVVIYDNCKTQREELRRMGKKPSLADDDPIYGRAIGHTFSWLKERARERSKRLREATRGLKGDRKRRDDDALARTELLDFGILSLEVPTGEALSKLLAPKKNAPTLLPTYLDLWSQTSPPPRPVPEVSLWLHGPSSGPPDVQVVWRADLTEDILAEGDLELAKAIVASIPPTGLEAMSLPFSTARAWLAQQSVSDLGDVEGIEVEPTGDSLEKGGANRSERLALAWRGDESVILNYDRIAPGDTLVVPVSYGGILHGCFDTSSTEPVSDRAEQANFMARAKPLLRLHPAVTKELGLAPSQDVAAEVRAALSRHAVSDNGPPWKRLWASKLAASKVSRVVVGNPGWAVLEGKRLTSGELLGLLHPDRSLEDGLEVTTDGDDSYCLGRAVTLAEHTANVERFAREYAERCGLGRQLTAHISLAAWLHDIGKADHRFQLMLRGGSEIELFKDETPWAKSAMPPGSRSARRLARMKSKYPSGGHHHALQSLAMLEGLRGKLEEWLMEKGDATEPDVDLVLHLVGSHHGDCRPFAPVLLDENPVDVSLADHSSNVFGSWSFPPTSSGHNLCRLDSPVGERFWRLVEKYGWLELCWLEAILRLADHRASEKERNATP